MLLCAGFTYNSYQPGGGDSMMSPQANRFAGGYTNSPSAGGTPSFSQGGSQGRGGGQRPERFLTPVTVKQLLEAPSHDNKFQVDGVAVSQVTLVGVVLSVDKQNTNVSYMFDDGTAKLSVREYLDSDNADQAQTVRENTYVRVTGNIRTFNETRAVAAFSIEPITQFDEVTFHFLDVVATHLRNTRGRGGMIGGGSTAAMDLSTPVKGASLSADGGVAGMDTQGSAFGGDVQTQVMAVFNKGAMNDQGTSIQEVCRQLPSISPQDIRKAIEALSEEGHLYSTIDEEHFQSTSMDG